MNKYGKADEYRHSVIQGMRAMKAEMAATRLPEPTCFCGGKPTIAETRFGGRLKLYCSAHEHMATLD
jgi:hypothetical protein